MSDISNLSDLYIDELKDLWSANDQMARVLKKIAPKATSRNSPTSTVIAPGFAARQHPI